MSAGTIDRRARGDATAGPAPARRPASAQRAHRTAGGARIAEIALFVGAGADRLRRRSCCCRSASPAYYSLFKWNGIERARPTSSASTTTRARAHRPGVPRRRSATTSSSSASRSLIQGPIAHRRSPCCSTARSAGAPLFRIADLRAVRAVRGHRRRRVAADPAARRADRRAAERLGLGEHPPSSGSPTPTSCCGRCSCVLTWKYIGFAIILFLAGLQGVPDELQRGRPDRRRELVADPAPHHPAAARPDHPDLGVPVDHRLAAAVRHGVDHDRRRPGRTPPRRWRPT